MSDCAAPEPPDVTSFDPAMMTASELHTNLVRLFEWLQAVEASSVPRYSEEVVQEIREAANLLLVERRDRHSDEAAPRGGQAV